MAELETRDDLEPPGVAGGRVVLSLAAVFALLAAALAIVGVFTALRIGDAWRARAHRFSVPALETNVEPRVTAGRSHGPKPYRELPARERTARDGQPDPALAAAMREIASRGDRGYDPLQPEPKP